MTATNANLVIVGAGPAGLAAALEARAMGLSVVLLDEQESLGGQIYRNVETTLPARSQVLGPDYEEGGRLTEAFRRSGAVHVGGASVWNVSLDGTVDYVANGKTEKITGDYMLLASGAMERPFPIEGWTLPGVMGAGAAQILLKSAGALPNTPTILAGCGPLLYLLAWQYLRAGARIGAVVDTTAAADYRRAIPHLMGAVRGWRDLKKGLGLLGALRKSGTRVYSGATGLAIAGQSRVEGLSFVHRGRDVSVPASLLLLHQGVVPNTQLSWSTGQAHHWDVDQLCWQPTTDAWGRLGDTSIYVAGDSRAIVGARASAVQGRLAAVAIGARLGVVRDPAALAAPLERLLRRHVHIRPFLDALYRPSDENRIPPRDGVVICRCEEVTAGQVRRYVELGCSGPNQTKAFGRCGMGPCQGRFCGLTVTEIIAEARDVHPGDVGYYRIRSPVKPVRLGDFVS